MVEDMEESVLCLGDTGKLLNVVNDKDVNGLIEVDKVVGRIVAYRVGILHLEQMSRNIQHPLLRKKLLDFRTDGIDKVRLPHPRCSVEEQRIKDGLGRILGHGLAYATRQFVAVSFDERIEIIVRIEVRIQV